MKALISIVFQIVLLALFMSPACNKVGFGGKKKSKNPPVAPPPTTDGGDSSDGGTDGTEVIPDDSDGTGGDSSGEDGTDGGSDGTGSSDGGSGSGTDGGGSDGGTDGGTVKPGPKTQQVLNECNNAKGSNSIYSMPVTITFQGSSRGCDWYVDNTIKQDHQVRHEDLASIIQGKYVEKVDIDLPGNAQICDLEFSSHRQHMYYDDEITLAINDYILFSTMLWKNTANNRDGMLRSENGLYKYRWDAPYGFYTQLYDDRVDEYNNYCIGTTCDFPETQTEGTIFFDIPEDRIIELIQTSLNDSHKYQSEMQFKFVTIGDNDPGQDCRHSPFSFDLDIKYMVK